MRALVAALLALGFAAAAQPRDVLTIGITQYPSTLHPNIENMAAKSYVLGFTRRPINARDADWALVCMLCETLPTLENGLAARETTPDGRPGIRVTLRLQHGIGLTLRRLRCGLGCALIGVLRDQAADHRGRRLDDRLRRVAR
jgi:peptide/nickel transport system substrate-binding protein